MEEAMLNGFSRYINLEPTEWSDSNQTFVWWYLKLFNGALTRSMFCPQARLDLPFSAVLFGNREELVKKDCARIDKPEWSITEYF